MNFEKIELYGFKSFADKAEIKFGNGITGIVGPNGCGKSNVADAIRWVLGEQSAKSLRGSNMQDVIFSGTQGRKSLSYCEVSLFFDNSGKMFSIDYNEVIITRKLYRSGESEYFINKQPARLKDIVDLLHECGIGKEGYTIIGQGKVEEIMSAKPEDRRLIFEEATGIAKFKSRKNESERKLERTHDNIVRYADILSEIENQLAPLERQAEKAREYNELSASLKHHEINTYIAKTNGAADAKAKISKRIKGVDEQTALRQSEYDAAVKEYDEIFSKIAGADEKLRALNDELLEKRVGMEKSSGAKQLYEQKIAYMNGQIARAEKEIENNEETVRECENSLRVNGEELADSDKELEALTGKTEKLSDKIRKLTERISLGEELENESRKRIIESLESLSDAKLSAGTKSIERKNIEDKIADLKQRLDKLTENRDAEFIEKDKCDKAIDELDRAVFDCKNRIAEKEDEVRSGNEEVAAADNKIYSLNSIITTLVTKDNFYRGLKDSYDGYAPAVKSLLNRGKENPELKKRIKGVVAELIKSDKKYDVALETALAAAAQNVVTETPDDAKYLINYLKANKLGRITFLPIASVKPRERNYQVTSALKEPGALGVADEIVSFDKKYYNVISNLLGNTLIVDTIENATRIANKYRFAFKMVTLDGDVFSTQGAMTGGSRRTESVGLLSNDRKIEDNAEQLKARRAEMDALKAKKAELEKKRDKSLDELGLLNDMLSGKRQQLVVEREKQSVSEKNLSAMDKDAEALTELIAAATERYETVTRALEEAGKGGEKLAKDKEDASVTADKHRAEYDKLRQEKQSLLDELSEAQVKITALKAKIEGVNGENERLSAAIAEAKESTESLKKSNANALEIIEELKRDEEKVTLTKEEQDYVNGIRKEIDDIENYKAGLRAKLNENEAKKTSLTEDINALTEKKHYEEIALAKIDSDLEHMLQSIWEDYQETYDTALKYREEGYDASKGEAEINRIKRKRSSLGAINASAIDDCKALKERYDEMVTQKEDLEKAEADLKEAIDKIKGEMITQFDEGFTKINENFQRIFKELFGGGRAMLQMDYSQAEDRLEAGVEIIAEPPGKKLQKLSLLSGGEKALTAIAILFAILRLRPMPFCVLDEVEAALDEANVDRFARYLQKFSEETQFIVITHKKPTMERANALFGVTMQEKGVSRLVSVKLSDVIDVNGDEVLA